jgi:hypothetical protein
MFVINSASLFSVAPPGEDTTDPWKLASPTWETVLRNTHHYVSGLAIGRKYSNTVQ